MEEFKVGQEVRVLDNRAAKSYALDTLGEVGTVFTVGDILPSGEACLPSGYYVPPAACELVEDSHGFTHNGINFSAMVAKLVKPGEDILATLTPEKVDLWHMATGVAGEAGEVVDAVKKYVVYNKKLDRKNIIEEFGDLEFYMEKIRQNLGITREETLAANIDKLGKRYAEGYSDKAAQERADKDVVDVEMTEAPAGAVAETDFTEDGPKVGDRVRMISADSMFFDVGDEGVILAVPNDGKYYYPEDYWVEFDNERGDCCVGPNTEGYYNKFEVISRA